MSAVNSPLLTVNEEGKILYAICAQKRNRRTGIFIPQTILVHAFNEGEARWIFAQDPDQAGYRIVACAPAIGFFVADNHGDQLIA